MLFITLLIHFSLQKIYKNIFKYTKVKYISVNSLNSNVCESIKCNIHVCLSELKAGGQVHFYKLVVTYPISRDLFLCVPCNLPLCLSKSPLA